VTPQVIDLLGAATTIAIEALEGSVADAVVEALLARLLPGRGGGGPGAGAAAGVVRRVLARLEPQLRSPVGTYVTDALERTWRKATAQAKRAARQPLTAEEAEAADARDGGRFTSLAQLADLVAALGKALPTALTQILMPLRAQLGDPDAPPALRCAVAMALGDLWRLPPVHFHPTAAAAAAAEAENGATSATAAAAAAGAAGATPGEAAGPRFLAVAFRTQFESWLLHFKDKDAGVRAKMCAAAAGIIICDLAPHLRRDTAEQHAALVAALAPQLAARTGDANEVVRAEAVSAILDCGATRLDRTPLSLIEVKALLYIGHLYEVMLFPVIITGRCCPCGGQEAFRSQGGGTRLGTGTSYYYHICLLPLTTPHNFILCRCTPSTRPRCGAVPPSLHAPSVRRRPPSRQARAWTAYQHRAPPRP
jgi:hypothetical protein